jgi:ribonuclease HII
MIPGSDGSLAHLVAGVDDAGRGPVIGPLVIAGVLMAGDRSRELSAMGVKDSKMLTPEQRTELAGKVRGLATKVGVAQAQPREIDEAVMLHGKLWRLNYLEARMMGKVLAELGPEEAYIDASDVNEQRFGDCIREFLPEQLRAITLVSEHHADRTYPVVSAASIIAKVTRDEEVARLHQEYGDFGSGYLTDTRTIDFLKEWRQTHTSYPPIVRLSWKTIRELELEIGQSRLGP